MSDYYGRDERPGEGQLAQAGWRRTIGQLVRFEMALAPWNWDDIDSLLDLGCGPATLADYMVGTERVARYVGVEARHEAVEFAREQSSGIDRQTEVRQGDIYDRAVVDETFDLVVAIGAQVDGRPADEESERTDRVRKLVDRCDELARQGAAIVVLNEAALRDRPLFDLEPVLFGVTPGEMDRIRHGVDRASSIRSDVLPTDLALYLGRHANGDSARNTAGRTGTGGSSPFEGSRIELYRRVIEYFLEQGGDREEVVWLWLEVAESQRAREALEELVELDGWTEQRRHLEERVEFSISGDQRDS